MYVPWKILNHELKYQGIDICNPRKYDVMDEEYIYTSFVSKGNGTGGVMWAIGERGISGLSNQKTWRI